MSPCVLCNPNNEDIIYTNAVLRVVSVADVNYPGFIRIISNRHVVEMHQLDHTDAMYLFTIMLKIETTMRNILHSTKINIASLGNVVPHLHWHMIPRYSNDKHYPNSIWGEVTNTQYIPEPKILASQMQLIDQLKYLLART